MDMNKLMAIRIIQIYDLKSKGCGMTIQSTAWEIAPYRLFVPYREPSWLLEWYDKNCARLIRILNSFDNE